MKLTANLQIISCKAVNFFFNNSMQQITSYKILTFILLPFAALFGFFAFVMFFIGLANPVILLPVFIMACFCIYTIACMIFLVARFLLPDPRRYFPPEFNHCHGVVAAPVVARDDVEVFSACNVLRCVGAVE